MLVVLNDEIFNMDRFDFIRPMPKSDMHGDKDRIAFFRDGEMREYCSYDSAAKRDADWERIKDCVNNWYT